MVLKAGADVGWEAIQDLTDRKRESDSEVVQGVYNIAETLANTPGSGIIDVHQVRVRRLGHYMLLDLHMRVDPRLSVTGGYFENNRMKRRIYAAFPNVSEIFVHVQAHSSRSQPSSNLQSSSSPYALNRGLSFKSKEDLLESFKKQHEQEQSQLERLNSKRSAFVSNSVRSAPAIQRDVKDMVEKSMTFEPVILGLSHSIVHYDLDKEDALFPTITVEANLRMDKNVTLERAEQAARVVRDRILELPDVDAVDLHVELLD